MNAKQVLVRVDATYRLTVHEGGAVSAGQKLCEASGTNEECICPVSGTIRSIRFDPDHHEFAISIAC
jgi:Na+-translocating ferredoxin:NAD+ oxidoreductase RnfC subunit